MSGVAVRRGQLIYYISLHRGESQAAFGEREKSSLRAVLAHVSLALENRWRLRQASDLATVLTGVVDRYPHLSILVDAEGCVVHCSRSATPISVSRAGLCIEAGRLTAATSVDRMALREAIRHVAEGATREAPDGTRAVALSVPGAQRPTVVSIYAAGKVFRAET